MFISDGAFLDTSPNFKFYREYDGLWTLEVTVEMIDEHVGKMGCIVRKFGGIEVWFDTSLMVDRQHKMIYFFDPILVDLRNRFFSQGNDSVLMGTKKIRKVNLFPHFFNSYGHLRNFIIYKFYDMEWKSRKDFTSLDCDHIRERMFAEAVRGGLGKYLPFCVLRNITDSLNTWAFIDANKITSRAWSKWLMIQVGALA